MSWRWKILITGASFALSSGAQSPAFEVASVKAAAEPSRMPMFCIIPCSPGERLTVTGSRVDIRYMSLFNLIVTAYRLKPFQLSGPDWIKNERFDIAATIPAGVTKDQLPEMIRSLLADRFKLTVRRDTKEQPVYALVTAKSGSKLERSAADPAAALPEAPAGSQELYTPSGEGRMLQGGGFVVKGGSLGPMRGGRGSSGALQFEFLALTMPGLADIITPHMDRPVVDMTNLKGAYHILIENHPPSDGGGDGRGVRKDGPPQARPGGEAVDPGPRSDPFFEGLSATLEKSGLKLEKSKAPVDLIVVEHVEKAPTAN